MKSLHHLSARFKLVLIVLTSLLLFSGCEVLEDEGSSCDDTKVPERYLRLEPNIYITYGNGNPYRDYEVQFEVYKTYCSGEVSGAFSNLTKTSLDGRASFNAHYYYKFANLDDKVYFTYTIKQGDNSWSVMPEAYNNYNVTAEGQLIHQVQGEITMSKLIAAYEQTAGSHVILLDSDYFSEPIRVPWNLEDVYFDTD